MITFTARVELLNANSKDYDLLQTEMKKEQFTTINKAGGHLAAFQCRNKDTIREVNDAVLRAAAKTGKKFTFTVMKDKHIEKGENSVRYSQA